MAPNKANFTPFWSENADSASKQTQSGRPGWAAILDLKSPTRKRGQVQPAARNVPAPVFLAAALSSFVRNKANFRRLWAENAGLAKKQSQSKPISTTPVKPAITIARPSGGGQPRVRACQTNPISPAAARTAAPVPPPERDGLQARGTYEDREELREAFTSKTPEAKAFSMPGPHKVVGMLRGDLAEAGIPYVDQASCYADFHAFRHTTGSFLAAVGVHPKVPQQILRHSKVDLTMSKYTHTLRGQEHEAVTKLPDLNVPDVEAQRATGTDGKDVTGDFDLAGNLAFLGADTCSHMQSSAEATPPGAIENGDFNTAGWTIIELLFLSIQ
jgi:hypothetical protein